MRKYLQHLKLFLSALLIINALSSAAQKQFTHTATKANNYCNANCTLLDIPELNNNPSAIIFAAPIMENGLNLNPHPIGVYYFKNRWSIFNLDQRPISEGAKFNVEYVAKPDSTHYQYLITRENLQKDGSAVIDHLPINNPNTQLRFIPCWVPEFHVAIVNRDEASIQFNNETGKWYISNINKKPLFERVGYNIIISSDRSSASYKAVQVNELNIVPISNLSTQPCKCPASLPPNGFAGGDLSGNYPGPSVQKLLGRALSNTIPNIGQVLKWDGTSWIPANDNTGIAGTINSEIWKNNGSNISNNNSGNVGIGTINPNSPLGFPAVLGKKITLYPGPTGDVGFGVSGNRLQIYADNPNADVAIGYDAAGSFTERLAVKANGALAVNGNTGNAGQVLQSNGNDAAASWVSSTNANYNKIVLINGTASPAQDFPGGSPQKLITGLIYTFSVTGNAKVLVSFTIPIFTNFCAFCNPASAKFSMRLNGNQVGSYRQDIPSNSNIQFSASNLLQVGPGTYTIEIFAQPTVGGGLGFFIWGTNNVNTNNMIIQVIPQ